MNQQLRDRYSMTKAIHRITTLAVVVWLVAGIPTIADGRVSLTLGWGVGCVAVFLVWLSSRRRMTQLQDELDETHHQSMVQG